MSTVFQTFLQNLFSYLPVVILIGLLIIFYHRLRIWVKAYRDLWNKWDRSSMLIWILTVLLITFTITFGIILFTFMNVKSKFDKKMLDYQEYCEKIQYTNFQDESSRFSYENYFNLGGKKYDCSKPIKEDSRVQLITNQYFIFGVPAIISILITIVTLSYRKRLRQ